MNPTPEEIDSKFYHKIYILESPSESEITSNINEGDALSAALNLCGLDNSYIAIDTKKSLTEAVSKVSEDINKRYYNKIPVPYLHFSLHGCKNGIGLANGEIIDWLELRRILLELNIAVKPAKSGNNILSRFSLSMSVCKGIFAYKMFNPLEVLNPFWSLVGPTSDVEWADSLVAFIVFYHSLIYKRSTILEAVERMNNSCGINVFRNFIDPKFIHI